MDAKDLDRLNLDLNRFFDFDNHVYHFHIWKGDFSLREMRSAATYADIAERFHVAITWIREVRRLDRQAQCAGCGAKARVARVLSFGVITDCEDVFREDYDDLGWDSMIVRLEFAVSRLREMQEPPTACKKCGIKSPRISANISGDVSGTGPAADCDPD